MLQRTNDVLQGTLALLVLRTLASNPGVHGHDSIGAEGRQQLAAGEPSWTRLTEGVARVLQHP